MRFTGVYLLIKAGKGALIYVQYNKTCKIYY